MAPFLYALLHVKLIIPLLCLLPLIIDGFTQLLTKYDSTNLRRLITGTLFGYGLTTLVITSFIFISKIGYQWGQSL